MKEFAKGSPSRFPSFPMMALFFLSALAAFVFPAGPAAAKEEIDPVSLGKVFSSVVKKASPAVVFVKMEKKVAAGPAAEYNNPFDLFNDEFFRRFFGRRFPKRSAPKKEYHVVGQGSGFIISNDGYILTNNHVVGGADRVTVKLAGGREFQAKIIGTDPHTDVALIKIDADHLPVLPLGNSDALDVGEWVLAVGNPFGLSHTVTAGIVSAKGRSNVGIADYEDFIQTDAAINPGNSGGPLLNLEGEVVGINTAIFSRSGGYMGIGFAIPINMAEKVKEQLLAHGKVRRGYLGVYIQDLTPELAEKFGLKDGKGVLVNNVTKDSPAEKAGLKQGDVIVELDGNPTGDMGAFRNKVALIDPGTSVDLTVFRDGKKLEISVELGELPAEGRIARGPSKPHALERLGITVGDLTKELADKLGYEGESGVVVTAVEPGSVAALAGIRAGTLIQEVNRTKVESVKDFEKALDSAGKKGSLLLLLKEGEYSRYVVIRLGD